MSDDYPFKGRSALYEGEHNGIRWCIYQAPLSGVLNGCARIPEGRSVDVETLDIHGGITYGSGTCTGWIGFDTAHAGDAWDIQELQEKVGIHVSAAGRAWIEQERSMWSGNSFERTWTVEALQAECERLCDQLHDRSTNG